MSVETSKFFDFQVPTKYTVLLVLIITVLLKYVPVYLRWRKLQAKCNKIPGPKQWPLIGVAHQLAGKSTYDIFKIFQKWHDEFGDYFMARIGKDFSMFLKSPKDMEIVLSSINYIDKSHEYKLLEKWLGTGLLLSSGRKWLQRRKMITPTFHFNILKQFAVTFDEHATSLVTKLRKEANGEDIEDILPIVAAYSLDVICETAMGVNLNSQNEKNIPYVQAIKLAANLMVKRFASLVGRFELTYKLFSSDYPLMDNAINVMHKFTERVIKQRRALLKTTDQKTNDNFDTGAKRKMAFLDMLLQARIDGKPLSDKDVREEVDTFMFEGHDTVSVSISFTLMLLSKHPEVQQKLYDELIGLVDGDTNAKLTYDDLNQMKYMENVIKESLRLYPSVSMIGRLAQEDIELTNNVVVPKGCLIFLQIYTMQRDPKNFPEPDKFIPERFEGERNKLNQTPYDYVPFSAGPRNCVGQKFAMLEMKSVVAKIVLNYQLLASKHIPTVTSELVLRPLDGIKLKLVPRTKG